MAKSLILNWVTAGWRFENTPLFAKHFVEQWKLLQDVAIKNLDEFFDFERAEGEWLNLIGTLWGLTRPYSTSNGAFILDATPLDDPGFVLDGIPDSIKDELYKVLINLKSSSGGKLFCIRDIANNLENLFPNNIRVEFIENIDYYTQQPRELYFQLKLYFKNASDARVFVGLIEENPHLLGKPMGVAYDIIIDLEEE